MEPKDDIKPFTGQSHAVREPVNVAKDAINETQEQADRTTKEVSDKVEEAANQLRPVLDNLSDAIDSAVQKVRAALHEATDQLRSQTQKASDLAVDYTKDEPLKAVLIAAATGALLMGLVGMMVRSRD